MKNTFLLLICCSFLGKIRAQTFAYNFPGDFDSAPSAFIKKTDGRFLIAGTTGGPSSNISSTNGYILDWDAEVGLTNSKQLEIYGGTKLYDMVELANGNIVASGWENFCSEPNLTLGYIKCFDPVGNLLWTRYTDTIPKNPYYIYINTIQLAVRPSDGKVAQLFSEGYSGTVNLLDPDTGEILFRSVLNGRYKGLAVNPANNNLVVINKSAITQINPNNGMMVIKNYLIPNWCNYEHLLVDAAGTIFAISDYGGVIKWTLNSSPITLTVNDIWHGIQWMAHGGGYVEYRQIPDGDKICFFNANFQLQSVLNLTNMTNFKVRKMYLGANTIFLAGYEEHGPQANTSGSEAEKASSNLLIRRFGYDGNPQATEDPDISITGITVEVPPIFTKLPGTSGWQILGGKYVLTMRNNGNIQVNEVHILSSDIGILQYDSNCAIKNKNHYSIYLQNINLAPGEETVVTIDSLNILSASAQPWNLCFWAAAPNQRRDVDYSNDNACLTFWDAVPTEEPIQASAGLRVFPNPATTSLRIVLPSASGSPDTYRIFNCTGRVQQQGIIPSDTDEFSAGIEEIPTGVYFVETGGVFGRFVKI